MRSDEVPEVRKVELKVPRLGRVTGLSLNEEVYQYLGIPYATIPGRFRRSTPAPEPWPQQRWDGTVFGPYCPQPPRDFYPVPSPPRPWLDMPVADEMRCLNLNITVPKSPDELKSSAPLPVMVFIHGGAFTYSMNSSPVYDGRILAATSSHLSQPTIVVTINYRLGVYGFLAGHDIQAYNTSHGEDGVGNYGVWDQVLALRWVKRHIAAFGGDPEKVALFGQSAGSVSVHCHLLRDEALFSAAIMQSGVLRLCGVMSVTEWHVCYEKLLFELGIPLDIPPSERVNRLLGVDTEALTAAMLPVFIVPVITMSLCDDGVLVQQASMSSYDIYHNFHAPKWCQKIMIGDCQNECIIWNKSWDNLSLVPLTKGQDLSTPDAKLVLDKMTAYLGTDKARKIASLYNLHESSSAAETFQAVERLTSHGIYSQMIYFTEQAYPSAYTYHFDVPSPFDNAWGGLAHHSYDNVLIWGVLRHLLPKKQQAVADKMAEAWIRFASGDEPWEGHGKAGRWMVFSEEGAELRTRAEDPSRGYEIWDALLAGDLVEDLSNLGDELCLRRTELTTKDPVITH